VSDGKVVMVLSGFPRHSETFALNELLALEAHGMLGPVFATKPGDSVYLQPGCERLMERVQVLPDGSPAEQAEVVVGRLKGRAVAGVHGYFAHLPAEVASLAAEHLGVQFGFSSHARDVRKVSPDVLTARARAAACVIACNRDVASEIAQAGIPIHLVPHGVDVRRFCPRPLPAGEPLCILAVGRLVEKKGFHVLIAAAARLSVSFHLRIVGDGPELGRLRTAITGAGLENRVSLCGTLTHAHLADQYAWSHVVAVPSIADRTGDRDGLPNVILEAMASGRPVVASEIGAIGTAVRSGRTGILVPPGDADALAQALRLIGQQPTLGERLGHGARRLVEREFTLGRCTRRLVRVLDTAYA
jgi:glycosyltransferase involved in cell wall biosynthesis